jgi:hypothetical protein
MLGDNQTNTLKDQTTLGKFDLSQDFLKQVIQKASKLAEASLSKKTKQPVDKSSKPGGILGNIIAPIFSNKSSPSKEKDLIADEEKPKVVLIGGITDEGYKDLARKLPDILKGIIDLKKLDKKEEGKKGGSLLDLLPPGISKLLGGALMAGGGITLLLGGLAALITGLNTEGPFKGLLKILSKVGIMGGLKLLEKGALSLIKNLKSFIGAPIKLFQSAYKALRGVFGKGVSKTLTGVIAKTPGLLTKMLGGLVKFITPLLKRLPLVGTVISLSFAYTRFKSGDVVGGIIDVLSGIASIIPGVGTAISIGLDVLNAFLDYKAGGATGEASKTKMGMIGDFFGKIYDVIGEKLSAAFTWVADLGKKFIEGKWGEAFVEVAKFVPGMGWVVDLMGGEEVVTQAGDTAGGQSINFLKGVKDFIFEKITNAMGWVGEIGKKWMDGKIGDVIVDICKTIPYMGWVVDLMGGEEKVTEVGNTVGGKVIDFRNLITDTIMGKLKPIFGMWVKIGEKFMGGDPGGALVDIAKMTPGLGWIVDLLGTDNLESSINKAAGAAASGDLFGSVAGLFEDISKTIKQKFLDNALSLIPDTILGFPVRALIAQKLGLPIPPGTTIKAEGWLAEKIAGAAGYDQKALEDIKPPEATPTQQTPTSTPETEINVSQSPQDKNNKEATVTETKIPAAEDGAIATSPTVALIGEAGPEAVIPLDKYMSPEGFKISNDLLGTIASNTANTNETIKNLSNAILKLASVFNNNQPNNNSNIIVNNQQSQQLPSAAQLAASNVDPIRMIRRQFAVS